jgi:hypothetical protein
MRSHHEKTWALVPADVAEWMGMWEAVPMPELDVAPAPALPVQRTWLDRLHLTGLQRR